MGPDGNMWFVEGNAPGRVARITTPPVAVTGAASVRGAGAAGVAGVLNGHAQPTSYRFEYGPTTAYGSSSGATDAGSGSADVPASADLTGLQPDTTYHYRLVATNPTDATPGADATFTTLPLPTVNDLAIRPKAWVRGSKLPQIAQTRRGRRAPVGTTISFSLSRAVPVRLRFFAVKPGRRVRGRCRAPTRGNRTAKRCKRLRAAGSISFAGRAGTNVVRFQGRISRRKQLVPGPYRLQVSANDPTSRPGAARSASFRIVRRSRS
jgi:hypothetical protein